MKSYKSLQFLKDRNIQFNYTPFDQGALINMLDKDWHGACNIISYEWMWKKIRLENLENKENFKDVASYQMEHSHLPHPFVFGDNALNSKDIERIREDLKKHYSYDETDQRVIDHPPSSIGTESGEDSLDNSINKLLKYIESKEYHYGIMRAVVYINEKDQKKAKEMGIPNIFGHAISFVKKGKNISWFDPNYGEINFNSFDDFSVWFKEEVKNGTLKFLFATSEKERLYTNLADIFPHPKFNKKELKEKNKELKLSKSIEKISEDLTERRTDELEKRKKITSLKNFSYDMFSFFRSTYIKPEAKPDEYDLLLEKSRLEENTKKNTPTQK